MSQQVCIEALRFFYVESFGYKKQMLPQLTKIREVGYWNAPGIGKGDRGSQRPRYFSVSEPAGGGGF